MDAVADVIGFVVGTALRFAPVFFLSVALAAVVKALPIAQVASRWLAQREHASVAAGGLLGTFSPFCSCTVVPVVRGLLVAGAPLAGVMAFWVASPLMDPEIFVLSVGLLGWDIAIARLVAALVLSLAAGYGAVVAVRRGWLERTPLARVATARAADPLPVLVGVGQGGSGAVAAGVGTSVGQGPGDPDGCCDREPSPAACDDGACSVPAVDEPPEPRGVLGTLVSLDWQQVRADFLTESWTLGRWILLAFALEALILRYVPQEAMVGVLGSDAPWAVPLAAVLGVPLYMDSLSALPVISGLLEQGMAPGAAIAFLLAGPVTTIPAMTAVRAVVPGPVFRYYLAVSLVGSMALGAAAGFVL